MAKLMLKHVGEKKPFVHPYSGLPTIAFFAEKLQKNRS
jgi:hypothetical protein